jgi:hypothetical protein
LNTLWSLVVVEVQGQQGAMVVVVEVRVVY